MESNLSEDELNKSLIKRLMKCIKNRETNELIEILDSIKPDKQSKIFLYTDADGNTCLFYAIKHKMPKSIIEKMVKIAKKGGILKQVLEIKNRHENTALDFAKKYNSDEKIVELILNEEQGSGIVSYFEYNGQNFTMSGNTRVSMGNRIENIRGKSQQKTTNNLKKLTQDRSGSTPIPSITIDGQTLSISHASDVHISDKGITVGDKKIV